MKIVSVLSSVASVALAAHIIRSVRTTATTTTTTRDRTSDRRTPYSSESSSRRRRGRRPPPPPNERDGRGRRRRREEEEEERLNDLRVRYRLAFNRTLLDSEIESAIREGRERARRDWDTSIGRGVARSVRRPEGGGTSPPGGREDDYYDDDVDDDYAQVRRRRDQSADVDTVLNEGRFIVSGNSDGFYVNGRERFVCVAGKIPGRRRGGKSKHRRRELGGRKRSRRRRKSRKRDRSRHRGGGRSSRRAQLTLEGCDKGSFRDMIFEYNEDLQLTFLFPGGNNIFERTYCIGAPSPTEGSRLAVESCDLLAPEQRWEVQTDTRFWVPGRNPNLCVTARRRNSERGGGSLDLRTCGLHGYVVGQKWLLCRVGDVCEVDTFAGGLTCDFALLGQCDGF